MYDELAEVYEWLVPEELLTPEGAAAAFAPLLEPGARVLDCACGTGTLAAGLALAGFDVVASDASEAMVARTRELAASRGVDVSARVCRWEDLDAAGGFDAVLCVGNSLTHARSRRDALAAMAGALRPGGLLVVTSRNWEQVRAGGSRVERAGPVARHGCEALLEWAWTIPPAWDDEHTLETAVVFPDDGRVGERLVFWPFTPAQLDDDLRACGLAPESSTFDPDVDRYMVTARAGASRASGARRGPAAPGRPR